MPHWLQIMLWIAAGLAALIAIYVKGLRPLALFIAETERTVPVLRAMTDKMSDPTIMDVLVTIAKQFKTDSGSSLRDVVNRLEIAAEDSKKVTDQLRISIESNRQLNTDDRIQLAKLLVLMEKLEVKADSAANLALGVATDLQESHDRASLAGDAPGESADAFSIQPPPDDPQQT